MINLREAPPLPHHTSGCRKMSQKSGGWGFT